MIKVEGHAAANKNKYYSISWDLGTAREINVVKFFHYMDYVHSIDFADSSVFEGSRIIISEIIGDNEIAEILEDQFDLYEKAKDFELKSKKFYLEKVNESELQIHKDLFQWLAAEENKHFIALENIITRVSRPKTRVENAGFSTTEEY